MADKSTYEIDLKDGFSPKLSNAGKGLDAFESKLGRIAGPTGSGGMLGAFSSFAVGAFAGLAASIGLVGMKILTLGSEMEQTKVSMEVLVGSADRANQLFEEMTQYANVTPFGNADIADAGKLLLSFGTAVEDIMPSIAMLGDVSGGNAQKLQSLSLAYAQMSSTGRLMGQDLLQMVNAGFNPLQVISEKTGLSMGVLKKKMEEGAIGADMVKAAFISATSEGGRFYQMTEKQAKTMAGAWSTFVGTIEHGLGTLGMKLSPFITKVLGGLLEGFELISRVDFGPFLNAFGQIYDMGMELWDMFAGLFEGLNLGIDGMSAWQMAFDALGGWIRLATTPLRVLIEGLTLLGKVGGAAWEIFKGMGQQVLGIINLDPQMIKEGALNTAQALKNGWEGIAGEVSDFVKREYDGWADVFAGGNSKDAEKAKETERFGAGSFAFQDPAGKGGKGKKGSGVDGEVRSGGVKNITININKLVESVNFASVGELSNKQALDIVQRALLTVVNDANLAV